MAAAFAVAAVIVFGFAVGSLIRYADGATLRRWRLSRRWDVSRLAREFIAAADEPLATLRGLTHMINAWERGDRQPSERYWLLYLRIFPECVTETASVDVGVDLSEADDVRPLTETVDVHALTETVRALEQQVAGLTKRLDELLFRGQIAGQQARALERRKVRPRLPRSSWTHLLTLLPAV
jgi:hypothetical protein